MKLRSIIKKTGLVLGGLLLACNIGCNARVQETRASPGLERAVSASFLETPLEKPFEKHCKDKQRPKYWQYPLNVLGGIYVRALTHENAHALAALAMGEEITEYHPFPFIPNKWGMNFGYIIVPGITEMSNEEKAIYAGAGPLADIVLIEGISKNLRNGRISRNHQPFWATTSLATRTLLLANAIQGGNGWKYDNDFEILEEATGVSTKESLALVSLYTLLSLGRIKDEFLAATGRKYYPESRKKKACIEAVPVDRGIALQYRRHF